MAGVLGCLICAAVFFVAARWGRSNTASLVPMTVSVETRTRRERVLKRGAISCYVWATLLLLIAVSDVITMLGR